MSTSMLVAESISAVIWWPTRGSPGAFVSSVVSSSGISGASIGSGDPSGRSVVIDRRTSAGSMSISAATSASSRMSLRLVSRARTTDVPTRTRSFSGTAANARSTSRLRCSAMRLGTSARWSRARSITPASISASRSASPTVTSSSYRPGVSPSTSRSITPACHGWGGGDGRSWLSSPWRRLASTATKGSVEEFGQGRSRSATSRARRCEWSSVGSASRTEYESWW